MCGAVSFKRGDSFYRGNKVTFEQYDQDVCHATVTGAEEFYVTVEKDRNGKIRTKCSCPKLVSFEKDCQHIAAVLIAISDHQLQGTAPIASGNNTQELTEGLLKLFNEQTYRSSGHQSHFENRFVLDVRFTCRPLSIGMEIQMFCIEMEIGGTKVQNIRDFLEHVKAGKPFSLSYSVIYDQRLHCFQNENDVVMQQLIQVMYDEKVYMKDSSYMDSIDYQSLLVPPSSWEQLLPMLTAAPDVWLAYGDIFCKGINSTSKTLPLRFNFSETDDNDYQLQINGLHEMMVMPSYRTVLYDGKVYRLDHQDSQRLYELKQMLDASGTNTIPISKQQIGYFLEKVTPALKKLGDVQFSKSISQKFMNTPLVAKLYLDRVGNRLLAGLEFHYENSLINPLETRDLPEGSMLIRDVEKEDEILQLIEESSFAKTDGGYYLHNEELEYEFLRYVVPKLQKLVQIYATTAVRNRIFRGNFRPQIRVKHKKERTNWLEFKFEMNEVPENQIREVLMALEEKRKYFRLKNGSLLSLDTREFEEIQYFLRTAKVKTKDLANGLDLPVNECLHLLDHVERSDVFLEEESFHQFIENLRNPGRLHFTIPESLDPILKNYQKQGFTWMKTLAYYGFGGILADDMGLGKTLQSITYILSVLPDTRKSKIPVLVVCPSSLTYNWQNEMMKFAPEIQAVVIDGKQTERAMLLKELSTIDVMITSYPLLRRDIKWYEKQTFHTVFYDEAQAFKNPITQTARAVKKIQADVRFALTGTPVENSLEELWSIFHVVFPDLFLGLKEYSHLTRKTISRRIRPFMLRRLKEDVLTELPKKVEYIESVELFSDQKKLYAAYLAKLRHDTLKHLDKDTFRKNKIKILAGITRLRQICCHPSLFVEGYKGSSAKFKQLLKIVEEARHSGRRVLIFSQFTKMLELIGRELSARGQSFFYLDGQTPSEERIKICNRFNAGERDLFLISLKAGGTGLNLMSADTVILFDTWWNPAVEEQAADRAHRIGQKNDVQVIKLVARGTIEEKMNELQEKKRHLIEEVIDSEGGLVSVLTEEDIREILMT